jgi:hypothetical protein
MDRPSPDPRPAVLPAAAWPSAIRTAAAALIILCVLVPAPAAGQVIRGQVVDAASGAAVPLARVLVTGAGQRMRTTTAADGRFSVRLRRGGSYRVQVTRAGYADGTRSLTLGADETAAVDLRLAAAVHRLDPVTVTGRPRRIKVVGRFYETLDSASVRVRAVGRPRSIWAGGRWAAPGECYQLSGNAERTGQTVTLTVEARPRGEPCDPATGGFAYDVTLRGLPPGSYVLRVLHALQDGARPPAMVMDTMVTVH